MTPLTTYTEDHLLEKLAIQLFAELGWPTESDSEESLGAFGTLGRETKSEVVLVPRLRVALERLNPDLPADALTSAISELTRDGSTMSLAAANRQVWKAQPAGYY